MVRTALFIYSITGMVIASAQSVQDRVSPLVLAAAFLSTWSVVVTFGKEIAIVRSTMYQLNADTRGAGARFVQGAIGGYFGDPEVVADALVDRTTMSRSGLNLLLTLTGWGFVLYVALATDGFRMVGDFWLHSVLWLPRLLA